MTAAAEQSAAFPASIASSSAGDLASQTLPWLAALAGACVLAWLIAVILRRWARSDRSGTLGGFDSEQLDQLRERGDLSDEEVRTILRLSQRQGPETAPEQQR